jgi:regulator of sirC expression with transglutaminase-like and TPR domain
MKMLDAVAHAETDPPPPAGAAGAGSGSDAVSAVRAVLSLPDEELDYARAKVAFDKLVDASFDPETVLTELDQLTGNAWHLAGPAPDDGAKLAALRTLIYKSGPWNDHRPFDYDHLHPRGDYIPNKLLHFLLEHRRGQCISMPILFLILADRLGLNVALVNAPAHVFVRYTDHSGRQINLEATSGAHPARLEWFRQCMPMSDRSIESGLYMRTLSRRECVALMATTVLEHLREEKRHEELIKTCGIILDHDPRAGAAMVVQGSAYGALLQREFEAKFPVPLLIPQHLRPRRLLLMERNNSLIEAAEALGWEPTEYDQCDIEQERRRTCS